MAGPRFGRAIDLRGLVDREEAPDEGLVPGDAAADDEALAQRRGAAAQIVIAGAHDQDLAFGDPQILPHVDERPGGAELLGVRGAGLIDELPRAGVPALHQAPEAVEIVIDLGGETDASLIAPGREDVALVGQHAGEDVTKLAERAVVGAKPGDLKAQAAEHDPISRIPKWSRRLSSRAASGAFRPTVLA